MIPTYRELFQTVLVLYAINLGRMTITTAINQIFGSPDNMAWALLTTVQSTVSIAISKMNPIEWMIFIGLTALETILLIIAGGYGFVARIAGAIIVASLNAAVVGVADYFDSNGTPCMSVFAAISQLFT
jgi:hypothetical protein